MNRTVLCLAGAALAAIALSGSQPRAQAPSRSRPLRLGEFAKMMNIPQADLGARAAYPVIRCVATELSVLDVDFSETVSPHDTVAGWGNIYSNNVLVGEWRTSSTVVGSNGIGTGLLQFAFSTGSVTMDLGYANAGGIKSHLPCRPILGGTGAFAKLTGNAAIQVSNNEFLVQLGVK